MGIWHSATRVRIREDLAIEILAGAYLKAPCPAWNTGCMTVSRDFSRPRAPPDKLTSLLVSDIGKNSHVPKNSGSQRIGLLEY